MPRNRTASVHRECDGGVAIARLVERAQNFSRKVRKSWSGLRRLPSGGELCLTRAVREWSPTMSTYRESKPKDCAPVGRCSCWIRKERSAAFYSHLVLL
jgi:hypothetical protein